MLVKGEMKMKKILYVLILMVFGISLSGCLSTVDIEELDVSEYEIRSISSFEELNNLAREQIQSQRVSIFDWLFGESRIHTADVATPESGAIVDSEQESHSSKTNVQVEGIDESDVVKNDDRYLYIANFSALTILDTQTKQIYTYQEEGFSPAEMYILEDHIVLIGTKMHRYKQPSIYPIPGETEPDLGFFGRYYYYGFSSFALRVLDISNLEDIQAIRSMEFPYGYHVNSRMIDQNLFLVINTNRFYNYENKEVYIPSYKDSIMSDEEIMLTENQIKVIGTEGLWGFQLLVSFDVTAQEEAHVEAYVGYFENMYASKDNFYITKSVFKWIVQPVLEERADDIDIETTTPPIEQPRYYETTIVYRFEVVGDKLEYRKLVVVPGHILNQFSMDEHEDSFRIVTTATKLSDFSRETFAWSFDVAADKFVLQGSVGNMGIDERVYSVRFQNDLAYVVTFRDIDPLYVVDFSNPEKLVVRSELKSPGVSDYLHLYNSGLLIGVGRDIDQFGRVLGVKISLFDVSNPDNTEEVNIFKVNGEYSYTELQYNHKALLILKELHVFALPIYTYSGYGTTSSQGMYVFRVDEVSQSISLEKIILHGNVEESGHYAFITRGVVISNVLYTVSRGYIGAYDLITKTSHEMIAMVR